MENAVERHSSKSSKRSSKRSLNSICNSEDDPVMKSNLLPPQNEITDPKAKPEQGAGLGLMYKVDDVPPWYLCIILGFQNYMMLFGSTASIPVVLAPALCLTQGSVAVSEILSTTFFVSGIITLIQSVVGIRLPLIQGATFSFLLPVFAILSLPKWQCPAPNVNGNNITSNVTDWWNQTVNVTEPPPVTEEELWKPRMREIQGAIITASLLEVVIGATGFIGYIMKFIGPLTITPTIALIGLALFDVAANTCASQWGIAVLTIVLITLFSQHLRNVDVPIIIPTRNASPQGKKCGYKKSTFPVFKMCPIILAIVLSWLLCFILTVTGAFPEDNKARTDLSLSALYQASWFRIPYPFQWGLPTFTLAGTLGMVAGVIAGMLESIGDYYACARMSAAPQPPIHAINRGIFVEGIGCVLAGMFGSGTGTTTYSQNIGAIGITKVGSRRVIQTTGAIMIVLGMFGKFGALFVTIPSPIIGGVFMTMFGMISAVGVSNLQYVDLNSSRNLFIFGFSILLGLSVPKWMLDNPGIINTGVDVLDQIITVLLGTSMFLGGTVAFILDNTVPGTLEERGIIKWRSQLVDEEDGDDERKPSNCYEIPLISKSLRKHQWTRYIPVCPTYRGYDCKCSKRCRRHSDSSCEENDNVKVTSTNSC